MVLSNRRYRGRGLAALPQRREPASSAWPADLSHLKKRCTVMVPFACLTILASCMSPPLGPQESQATDDGSLHVAPATVWISVGEEKQLLYWVDGSEADSVDWTFTSSDPAIAAVTEDGRVNAKGPGKVKISVSADVRGNGKKVGHHKRDDAVVVTVTDAAQEASIGMLLGVANLADTWQTLPYTRLYDSIFAKWSEEHWNESGGNWGATYYDRGLGWYAAWWRTGDAKYLERADIDIVAYRDEYILPNSGGVPPRWSNPEGLALHYLVTGDEQSREALAQLADVQARTWLDNMMTTQYQDGRIQGRTVLTVLMADLVDARPIRDWAADTRFGVDELIKWYEASGSDGSWDMKSYCNGQANFQVAHALLEALIRYYDLVEPDPRIPPIVKASLDYMWEWWRADDRALTYLTVACDNGGANPAPDVNLLSVPPFGWYYQYSGDETYRTRGDALFLGGLWRTFWSGNKQFNQSVMRSWRYPAQTN